jgi:hypothetical protein
VSEVLGVPFAVVFERLVVLVVLPAVQLDDQVVVGEVSVDLAATDLDVDQWGRQPVLLDEGEELVLERGAGGIVGVVGEGSEQPGAGMEGVAGEGVGKLSGCRNPSRRASLTRRVSVLALRRGAMSRMVRAGLVVGTPNWRRTSRRLSDRQRWVRMPRGRRSPAARVTSGGGCHRATNPHRKAAER